VHYSSAGPQVFLCHWLLRLPLFLCHGSFCHRELLLKLIQFTSQAHDLTRVAFVANEIRSNRVLQAMAMA